MSLALLAAALLASPAPTPTAIDGRNPTVLQRQMTELGYAPVNFTVTDATATTTITVAGGRKLTLVLAGCTMGSACTYAVVLGVYTDVVSPPATWVAKANKDFDLIKVWLRDDQSLTYSDGGIIDGMSRETFRKWITGVLDSSNDLAKRAITDKLIKK